jgi:response regulator RpfG family c-di-GMP phosphodiesterase
MQRPYKEALSHDEAKTIIVEKRGRHFEPFLVDRFLSVEDRFREIFDELREETATPDR